MFGILLLACARQEAPQAPPRPTLGVAVPLSGADAPLGEAALQGVRVAAGADVVVLPVDDADPSAVATLAANPVVIGVVAHVARRAAESTAASWLATDLPTIVAAPGDHRGLPRVVPPVDASARCAAALLTEDFWVRTDSSTSAMVAGRALLDASPDHALGADTVDGAHVSNAAARLTGRNEAAVVWAGDAAGGGNLLRALRQVGSNAAFFGVGLYDPRFLQAAGSLAEGARVTSERRPARDQRFVDAFAATYGTPPSNVAVDAHDAAALLVAAWRSASEATRARGAPLTRKDVAAALRTVVADGASGLTYLDADGVVSPILCPTFVVRAGAFEFERLGTEPEAPTDTDAPAAGAGAR